MKEYIQDCAVIHRLVVYAEEPSGDIDHNKLEVAISVRSS